MSIETELKLDIDSKYIKQFLQHPLLKKTIYTTQDLYNIYFDTYEHDLLRNGIGLRVRRIGDKWMQTIKTANQAVNGLHQRQEWEVEINSDTPEYDKFPAKALPTWCAEKNNLNKIKPLFTTNFQRMKWNLEFDDGSKIELVLDQGEVKANNASAALSEIELELKAGSVEKLYEVAEILQQKVPLLIKNQTKAAIGYSLC
jgi:triphosphatase